MTEKREVIRRLRHGQSIRKINRDTGIRRTVIRQLKTLAKEKGWLDTKKKVPSELAIAITGFLKVFTFYTSSY